MAVAFRQPTFQNPLPKAWKVIAAFMATVFAGMIAMGESAGRARAAAELHRQGYHEAAKEIMLRK